MNQFDNQKIKPKTLCLPKPFQSGHGERINDFLLWFHLLVSLGPTKPQRAEETPRGLSGIEVHFLFFSNPTPRQPGQQPFTIMITWSGSETYWRHNAISMEKSILRCVTFLFPLHKLQFMAVKLQRTFNSVVWAPDNGAINLCVTQTWADSSRSSAASRVGWFNYSLAIPD